ncbi:hypothetical protein J45TS6_19960 [Paenibacillus sp. J45TS6]|uniref:hypothetical protein n=1 Tax=Paenibacillus sp. J45TS6 TaxID=2807196 RepID=UPI001B2DCA6B|nr:hypothetical protein [Paenibacillus sp. J45TS6]GIP43537.1 hypothetical protein J45TS6_19960 [Paenibacillus sp. J45TS6]
MYLIAQKNVGIVNQLIDIYRQSEVLFSPEQSSTLQQKINITTIKSKLEQVLSNCDLQDLKTIYAVASIGIHERGERHHFYNNTIEIIEIEIKENEEELLNKHSRYIALLTYEELIEYFLSVVTLAPGLIEGKKILKLT